MGVTVDAEVRAPTWVLRWLPELDLRYDDCAEDSRGGDENRE